MARVRDFNRYRHGDANQPVSGEQLDRIQDSIEELFEELATIEIIDGVLVEDIEMFTGTTKLVPHALGKKFKGWIIVRQDANVTINEVPSSGPSRRSHVALVSNGDVKISLWVF